MLTPSIFGNSLFDEMMDFPFEDDFFGRKRPAYSGPANGLMRTDVSEKEDSYEVDIDLPGYKKEDLNIHLDNGNLIITATKNTDNEQKDKDGKYIRRERYSGSMSRSFYVGKYVTEEDIHAKFENGILKLNVPKRDAKPVEEKKYVTIEG